MKSSLEASFKKTTRSRMLSTMIFWYQSPTQRYVLHSWFLKFNGEENVIFLKKALNNRNKSKE